MSMNLARVLAASGAILLLNVCGCRSSSHQEPKSKPDATPGAPAEAGNLAPIGLPVDVPFDGKPELVALDKAVKQLGGTIRVYKNAVPDAAATDAAAMTEVPENAPLQVAIDLHGTSVTDAQITQISQLPAFSQVTVVNVAQSAISDESLVQIAKAEQLEFLSISGTKVTDRGLEHLMGHKRLALIYMDCYEDGRGISRDAEHRLLKSLPNAPPVGP
jgi:hypothetical protein